MIDKDDLAYEIAREYLLEGPEYFDIIENAWDNGFDSEEDFEYIHKQVRNILAELRGNL